MATVFTSETTNYQFYLKLTLEEITPGTATSDPQISYKLQLYSGVNSFSLLRINAYVKLGGAIVAQVKSADQQWSLSKNSNITLLNGTATVPHDGSANISVEYAIDMDENYFSPAPDITATGTMPVTAYEKYGFVYIDNGTSLEPYQCYIDNGTGWDLYHPYIDNGSGWDKCN